MTEFASWDNSSPVKNIQEQKNYMAGAVNFLERDPDVYRYSWFIGLTEYGIYRYPHIDLHGADGMLTELGQLYMDIPVYDPQQRFEIPGRIECEAYFKMNGLYAEITDDVNGFLNMGWTDANDWAEYKINVAKSGIHQLNLRISGANTGVIDFLVDGKAVVSVKTPSTGGWQSWRTVSAEMELGAGEHILKMLVADGGFNINWLEISGPTAINEFRTWKTEVYPNPVSNGILNVNLHRDKWGGKYFCSIFDMNGKSVFQKEVQVDRAMFQLNINENVAVPPGFTTSISVMKTVHRIA